MTLGEIVKYYRKKRGLSQAELARLIGANPSFISRIESGDYKVTSPATIRKLAAVLKIKPILLTDAIISNSDVEVDYKIRSPMTLVRELTAALPELIPVYEKLGVKRVVDTIFLPQPSPTYGGKEMKLFGIRSGVGYRDVIRKGDILVCSKDVAPRKGDLCICDNGDRSNIGPCAGKEDSVVILTIIRRLRGPL